ncbi:OLC1v1006075C1 [Oldenlandia corymbosa var. corymbosa]|uniref:OLC1v1006075C1 n=1 Tax=Oldenlandia corymbosa var. corymbosa TaxID=529605 RepID=A0AAV1DJI8_OLDCO|nr:OLC1v1006075C1 [Oldenlandia corymbosa var. corymbosa]
MAQLERGRKSLERTPKSPYSPTFQQLLQGEAACQYSTSPVARHHDHEEALSPNSSKKSMLARVRERAKKIRQSFIVKKKNGNEMLDSHGTPSWGVSLEDEEDEIDEDPEYFGAPMYESELAPESLKEAARQHPRANPVLSLSHISPKGIKHEDDYEVGHEDKDKDKPVVHNKTITETMSEKLAPAYAAVSDATHTIASKIAAGLTISIPDQEHPPQTHPNVEQHSRSSQISPHGTTRSPQKWDKGVSVREYFMNKLEPGEDDIALSLAISEAISPKKSPGEMGVVEKVREAVTSFLRHDEPSQISPNGSKSPSQTSPREAIKETDPSSNNLRVITNNKVVSSNSISSANAPSLADILVPGRGRSIDKPSVRAIKITSSSSSSPRSLKKQVPSPKSVSSRNQNAPYIPISFSSTSSSTETIKAKNLSYHNPLTPETKSTVHSSTGNPAAHITNSLGEQSKVSKSSSNTPVSSKKGVQTPNFIFSSKANGSTNASMARSKSLSAHVHVLNNATSSPSFPISTNVQEVDEEQTHGRILQAN